MMSEKNYRLMNIRIRVSVISGFSRGHFAAGDGGNENGLED